MCDKGQPKMIIGSFRRPFRTEHQVYGHQTLRVWLISGCASGTRPMIGLRHVLSNHIVSAFSL